MGTVAKLSSNAKAPTREFRFASMNPSCARDPTLTQF